MTHRFHADCQARLQLELNRLQHSIVQLLQQENHAAEAALALRLQQQPVSSWPDLLTANKPWCIRQQLERLEAVIAALSQIELKLYGVCSDCEAQIEQERLELDAASQRCTQCEERHKKRDEISLLKRS